MKLDVEIKTAGAEADVLRALRDAAWSPEDFVVTSFDDQPLTNIRAIRADVQIGGLIEGAMDAARVKKLRAIGVDFIGPCVTALYSDYNNHQLNEALLDEVAQTGVALVPWVEDNPVRIRQLLADPAVVGVITDDVAAAAKARRDPLIGVWFALASRASLPLDDLVSREASGDFGRVQNFKQELRLIVIRIGP